MTLLKKENFGKRKHMAVSPIMATVILLGITVVGGGVVFAVFTQGSTVANTQTIPVIENAQGVAGTGHTDITTTVKNGGSTPWDKLDLTVTKDNFRAPLLYESIHEIATATDDESLITHGIRTQWIAHLDVDIPIYKDGVVDEGEGVGVGNRFNVGVDFPSVRKATIFNGTAVAQLFDTSAPTDKIGKFRNGTDASSNTDIRCNAADANKPGVNCNNAFVFIDPSWDGSVTNCWASDRNISSTPIICEIRTHKGLETPLAPGESIFLYGDGLTQPVPGLNNQVVNAGDNLVINVAVTSTNGDTGRTQTILKVR